MERYRMTAEQARDHLQRLSQVMQVPLSHLAAHIVATRVLPEPAPAADVHP
jgi:hypothetical protein